jgi:alpha-acetolactate decarboxylase
MATLYQRSTIGALLAGIFDGDETVGELLTRGDFGLGTFNALDGEMVVLDGACYHLRSDGTVELANLAARTPFAAVTRFEAEHAFTVSKPHDRGTQFQPHAGGADQWSICQRKDPHCECTEEAVSVARGGDQRRDRARIRRH